MYQIPAQARRRRHSQRDEESSAGESQFRGDGTAGGEEDAQEEQDFEVG